MVETLPGQQVRGVTSLDNNLYVLRDKSSEQIEIYDIDSYNLLRCVTVPELRDGAGCDIVVCVHKRCAYISDCSLNSIHRVALSDDKYTVTHWPVDENDEPAGLYEPAGLAISHAHGVLVTCPHAREIKEFSPDGELLQVLMLSEDLVWPWHAVQLSSGQFIVCHGRCNDPLNQVCLVDSDGIVVKSLGGPPGSGSKRFRQPFHLAVDRNDCVFVLDKGNRRVLLVSPETLLVRDVVVSPEQLWCPHTSMVEPLRVHVDDNKGHLYVSRNCVGGNSHLSVFAL